MDIVKKILISLRLIVNVLSDYNLIFALYMIVVKIDDSITF